MTNFPTRCALLQSVVVVLSVLIELYRKDLDGLNSQLRSIEEREDFIEETKYRIKIEIRNIQHQYNDLEDKIALLEEKDNLTDEDKAQINNDETVMCEMNARRLFLVERMKDLREESVQVSKESNKLEVGYDRLQQNILSLQDRVVSVQSELKEKPKKQSRSIRQKEHEETKEIDHNDVFSLKKSRTF